jgi:hypothetical protein
MTESVAIQRCLDASISIPKFGQIHRTRIIYLSISLTFCVGLSLVRAEGWVSFVPMPASSEIIRNTALFTPLESEFEGQRYQYRLFVPRNVRPDEKLPLLLWLHGDGESGIDNWRQLAFIRDEVARRETEFSCFILAPQKGTRGQWQGENASLILKLIENVKDQWPVDDTRLYVAGVSNGGNFCWKIAADNPTLFAGLCPMGSSGFRGDYKSLCSIPIWCFHSSGDSPEGDRSTAENINLLGGACWLTELPGDNHNCWTPALNDYNVIDWLLAQKKGSPPTPIPLRAIGKNLISTYFLDWTEFRVGIILMVLLACNVIGRIIRRRVHGSKRLSVDGTIIGH